MQYTTDLSITFLLLAVVCAYISGRIHSVRLHGDATMLKPALVLFLALFVAVNIIGIHALPTL